MAPLRVTLCYLANTLVSKYSPALLAILQTLMTTTHTIMTDLSLTLAVSCFFGAFLMDKKKAVNPTYVG